MRRTRAASPSNGKAPPRPKAGVSSTNRPVPVHVLEQQCENKEMKVQGVLDEVTKLREEFENAAMTAEENLTRRYEAEQEATVQREQYISFVTESSECFANLFAKSEAEQADINEKHRLLQEMKESSLAKAKEATELLAQLEGAQMAAKKAQMRTQDVKEGVPALLQKMEQGNINLDRHKRKAWKMYSDLLKDEAYIDDLRTKINRTRRTLDVLVLNVRNALLWTYDDDVKPPYAQTLWREVQNLAEVQKVEKTGLIVALGMDPDVFACLENAFRETFQVVTEERHEESGARMLRSKLNNTSISAMASETDLNTEDDEFDVDMSTTDLGTYDVAILQAPFECEEVLDCISSLAPDSLFGIDQLVGHKNCGYYVVLMHDPVPPSVEALFPKWRLVDFGRKPKSRADYFW